jgi:hypothetical protein
MRVLDQNASVRTILPSQVTNKIEARRTAVATDRNGSEIRVGDSVRETSGEMRSGTILHIHRSFLFCNNRTQIENSGMFDPTPVHRDYLTFAGIFVTRCVNVVTMAAKGARVTSNGPDLSKMNPALQMKNGMNGNGAMAPPKSFGRDRTLGKTVTIRKGPYKGMLGIVKDATDTTARVELHSKSKVVNIDKDSLAIKEYVYESFHLEFRYLLTIFQSDYWADHGPAELWWRCSSTIGRSSYRLRWCNALTYSDRLVWWTNPHGRSRWRSHSCLGCRCSDAGLVWTGRIWH